jgi:hypothetical protein
MMPAYMINIEHQEHDQVFSYYHGDAMLHFNASLLARLHKQMPKEFARITLDIGPAEYDLCMRHRGIEEDKLTRLTATQLREPGYAVVFEDFAFTIVDGHHRLVRRFRGNVRVMDFFVASRQIWQHCLVEYNAEAEAQLAQGMPERTNNPARLATHATLHPKERR